MEKMSCSRVRIETTALTIRGLKHQDFQKISFFTIQAIKNAQKIKKVINLFFNLLKFYQDILT